MLTVAAGAVGVGALVCDADVVADVPVAGVVVVWSLGFSVAARADAAAEVFAALSSFVGVLVPRGPLGVAALAAPGSVNGDAFGGLARISSASRRAWVALLRVRIGDNDRRKEPVAVRSEPSVAWGFVDRGV